MIVRAGRDITILVRASVVRQAISDPSMDG